MTSLTAFVAKRRGYYDVIDFAFVAKRRSRSYHVTFRSSQLTQKCLYVQQQFSLIGLTMKTVGELCSQKRSRWEDGTTHHTAVIPHMKN